MCLLESLPLSALEIGFVNCGFRIFRWTAQFIGFFGAAISAVDYLASAACPYALPLPIDEGQWQTRVLDYAYTTVALH